MGHRLCCQTPSKMKHHLCALLLAVLSLLGGAWPARAHDTLGRNHVVVAAHQPTSRVNPDPAEAHYNLGVTYLMLGDQGSAREEYTILKPLDQHLATALLRSLSKES